MRHSSPSAVIHHSFSYGVVKQQHQAASRKKQCPSFHPTTPSEQRSCIKIKSQFTRPNSNNSTRHSPTIPIRNSNRIRHHHPPNHTPTLTRLHARSQPAPRIALPRKPRPRSDRPTRTIRPTRHTARRAQIENEINTSIGREELSFVGSNHVCVGICHTGFEGGGGNECGIRGRRGFGKCDRVCQFGFETGGLRGGAEGIFDE
mmetsp:Transcript_43348/g.91043  ORF Transcript_43348/g.91043 Transcript_43348/m.91043 type:complete len:203 (+) Transcript_43348:148-756(+)